MYSGKLVFAQLMDNLPLHTFRRLVARYAGERKVKSFTCLDQYLCMAFAQLTARESLRDIETCLRAQSTKLYHLGLRSTVARNTLANANAVRDWRIYADFAQSLIAIAKPLYADDSFGVELKNTMYGLDTTTIDLCLSAFPWAPFRAAKAAVKLHTLLDLRGNIPTVIHISDGKLHEINILDQLLAEPGAFYLLDRGFTDFARLHRLHAAGMLLRDPQEIQSQGAAALLASGRAQRQCDLRPDRDVHRLLRVERFRKAVASYPPQRCRDRKNVDFSDEQFRVAGADDHRALSVPLAGGIVLQVDPAASANQSLFWHVRECGQDANLDCGISLCARGNRENAARPIRELVRNPTDPEPHPV